MRNQIASNVANVVSSLCNQRDHTRVAFLAFFNRNAVFVEHHIVSGAYRESRHFNVFEFAVHRDPSVIVKSVLIPVHFRVNVGIEQLKPILVFKHHFFPLLVQLGFDQVFELGELLFEHNSVQVLAYDILYNSVKIAKEVFVASVDIPSWCVQNCAVQFSDPFAFGLNEMVSQDVGSKRTTISVQVEFFFVGLAGGVSFPNVFEDGACVFARRAAAEFGGGQRETCSASEEDCAAFVALSLCNFDHSSCVQVVIATAEARKKQQNGARIVL